MRPTDVLSNEHRIIEQVLACLEKLAGQCAGGRKFDLESAREAITFFQLFAGGHDVKEENVLFPVIEAIGFPRQTGPTGILVEEHEVARWHIRAMSDLTEAAAAGGERPISDFAEHTRALTRLLQEHIRKEDVCVYPMVEQAIGERQQQEMLAAFEKLDHDQTRREARDACREIADRLADRFGVPRAPLPMLGESKSCQCWLYGELDTQKRIIERQNFAMTRDLEMARQVQRTLIPQASFDVPGLEIAFDYQPVVQVGGDVLDMVPLSGNRVLLFVGDVVGHGVGAALTMSAVKAALLSAVKADPHPESVLADINKVVADMFGDHGIPQFVTAACCLVDPEGARAEIAIAGHPKPLWLRARAGEIVQTGESGLPLGIAESGEHLRTSLALEPGDALLLYTDGLVEAFDPNRQLYGYPRFMEVVLQNGRSNAAELADVIRRDLDLHRNGHVLVDDLALLVVKLRS